MTKGQFNGQVNFAWKLLGKLQLAHSRVPYPQYEKMSAGHYRSLSYTEEWKTLVRAQLFDILLNDLSLFQFKRIPVGGIDTYSYSYYEKPYEGKSYLEFLKSVGLNYYEAGLSRFDEYCDSLESVGEKQNVTPTRYDYSPDQYKEARHPASHVHLGYRTNIRIGTKKILRPLSFVLFVLRQYHPDSWEQFLRKPIPKECKRSIRENLSNVPAEFFNSNDEYELMLV